MSSKNTESQKEQQKNFAAACKEARTALAEMDRSEILGRYKIGSIVMKVRDAATFGDGAVERMERELGLDQKTLYRYTQVAEAWTAQKIKELANRRNGKDLPITWSHLELIASAQDGRVRRGLVARVLKENLTVRALRAILAGGEVEAGESTDINEKETVTSLSPRAPVTTVDSDDAPSATTSTMVESPLAVARHLAQTLSAVERQAASWDADVMVTLAQSRGSWSADDRAEVADAVQRLEHLTDVLRTLHDRMQTLLKPASPSVALAVVATETSVLVSERFDDSAEADEDAETAMAAESEA